MIFRSVAFNIILAVLGLACAPGCSTTGSSRGDYATMRFHLESNVIGSHGMNIAVYRKAPVMLRVQRDPFLDEGEIASASVVDQVGGFALRIQFTHRGGLILDTVATANRGKRIAIFSNFPESRWLAAPLLTRRKQHEVLVFTPDATREEAERIARGLNHVAKKLQGSYAF